MKKKSSATYRVSVGQATTELSRDEFVKFIMSLAAALGVTEEEDSSKKVVDRTQITRGTLVQILEANDWNIALVSRELGITRRTLYMRLAAFGIERKKVPRLAKPI